MPTSTNDQPETQNPAFDPAYKAALDARRPALGAISEDQILRDLKLDASRAADVAEGTSKKLLRFRPDIAARFGERDASRVDELATTARACKQADIELELAEPSGDLSELAGDVSHVYSMLIADATSLWKRDLIDGTRLEKARDVKGYRALLRSTLVLIALLRDEWSNIEGRSLLSLDDLARAEQAVQRMSLALAHREEHVDAVPARELRARALSMLVRDYEEIRRMMIYLRHHHGDVDEIIPSLWAIRGRTRNGEREGSAGGAPVPSEPPNGQPAVSDPTNGQPAGGEPAPPPTPGDDDSPFTP